MYVQPSSLVVLEAEVHYDANNHPRSKAARQWHRCVSKTVDWRSAKVVEERRCTSLGWGQKEVFNLQALLFVTINDWPALGNLSGQTNKGYNAYTHCFEDIESIYLKKCRKIVYLRHRRFLPANHPLRKKGSILKAPRQKRFLVTGEIGLSQRAMPSAAMTRPRLMES